MVESSKSHIDPLCVCCKKAITKNSKKLLIAVLMSRCLAVSAKFCKGLYVMALSKIILLMYKKKKKKPL